MFYRIKDNKIYDYAEYKYLDECLETDIITASELEEYPNKVIIVEGELVLNPNFEQEQKQQEIIRMANLNLTGADVERGIYQARGMDFDDIITMVISLQQAQDERVANLDLKALKIELKANHFYRGNPYVSAVGELLGFSEEQLDEFFKTNDYKKLLPLE